jgi:hypothetical protein
MNLIKKFLFLNKAKQIMSLTIFLNLENTKEQLCLDFKKLKLEKIINLEKYLQTKYKKNEKMTFSYKNKIYLKNYDLEKLKNKYLVCSEEITNVQKKINNFYSQCHFIQQKNIENNLFLKRRTANDFKYKKKIKNNENFAEEKKLEEKVDMNKKIKENFNRNQTIKDDKKIEENISKKEKKNVFERKYLNDEELCFIKKENEIKDNFEEKTKNINKEYTKFIEKEKNKNNEDFEKFTENFLKKLNNKDS